MTQLDAVMAKVRAENRAALIAYIPAGFPSQQGCAKAIQALAAAGVDAIEIGFPYSDPVMDGPVIQEAAEISLKGGTNAADVFAALKVATPKATSYSGVGCVSSQRAGAALAETSTHLATPINLRRTGSASNSYHRPLAAHR